MNIMLGPEASKLVEAKLKSGQYASPEAVVLAGLQVLIQQPEDALKPGEMEALLAQGEASFLRDGPVPGEEAFKRLERLSEERRGRRG
jgi:hypothetical protein